MSSAVIRPPDPRRGGGNTLATLAWLCAAVYVWQSFDVLDAVRFDPRVRWCESDPFGDGAYFCNGYFFLTPRRNALQAALALAGMAVITAVYCVGYLQTIRRVPDYEAHAPWTVPVATATGIASLLLCGLAVFGCRCA